jgi:hypothetical protein
MSARSACEFIAPPFVTGIFTVCRPAVFGMHAAAHVIQEVTASRVHVRGEQHGTEADGANVPDEAGSRGNPLDPPQVIPGYMYHI